MSTPFQNRLVGTIIVAAVVIIFLPDVLDGEKKQHQVEFEAIPQAVVFTGKLTNKPFPQENLIAQKVIPIVSENAIDEVYLASPASKPTPKKEENKKQVVVSVKKKPVEISSKPMNKLPLKATPHEAWVIHLGSFKNKDNVAQILKKLKSAGYIVFTKPIKTKQGMLTKVIIGPELIQSALTKKLPALKALTGIQGKVAYFVPNK